MSVSATKKARSPESATGDSRYLSVCMGVSDILPLPVCSNPYTTRLIFYINTSIECRVIPGRCARKRGRWRPCRSTGPVSAAYPQYERGWCLNTGSIQYKRK